MVGPMNLESLGSGMSFWASAPESGPMEITEKKVSKTKINKDKQISVVSAESAHFRRHLAQFGSESRIVNFENENK